jgi:hypothetical protein
VDQREREEVEKDSNLLFSLNLFVKKKKIAARVIWNFYFSTGNPTRAHSFIFSRK